MKVLFNNFVNNVHLVNFKANDVNQPNKVDMSIPQDTFVKSSKAQDVYMQRLNELFPNGMLDKIYVQMGKELGIDVMPSLKFYGPSDNVVAGGFTFSKNEISFSLSEIFDNDHKVVMVKNGMYKIMMNNHQSMPLFTNKALGEEFVKMYKPQFQKVVDDLKLVSMTDDDFRKFVVHKMYHELIHAQQHMMMRSTEGIGEKEVIKAWTHLLPENEADVKKLDEITENIYKNSYWANKTSTPQRIKKDSDAGKLAYTWLDAVRKYPPVDSPEYMTNAIEADAYKRSYEYLVKNFGPY